MSTIDRGEVARVAHLSRLELDAAALDAMTTHLQNMIEFAAALDSIDRKDASTRVHGETGPPSLRGDEPRPSLTVAEALSGAPDTGRDGFKVPAVLE